MKKVLVISLLVMFLLVGCDDSSNNSNKSAEATDVYPKQLHALETPLAPYNKQLEPITKYFNFMK